MKKAPVLVAILLVAVVLVIGAYSLGRPGTPPVQPPPDNASRAVKGVTLSPKSFQPADFEDFFLKAREAGGLVSWAGDWNEVSNSTSGAPAVVTSLSLTYNCTPIVEAQFFTQSDGRLLRPLNETTMQNYKEGATTFADRYKPKYLGLGIEVNVLYEKSPTDFDAFIRLFNETYDAVKARSPSTKVFTVFQLEKMKGLSGGLFGGTNDPSKAEWALLDRFSKSDIAAFTTYPGLIYRDPSEIPAGYYTEISLHTSKPIAFTEIGWHTDTSPAGWESSGAEQAEFVAVFFNLTGSLNKEFSIWSFLYDQNTIEPFKSMGLYYSNGTAKPAWSEWIR